MREKNVKNWKKNYTWMLLANVAYIVIFYFLMQIFS